jgi:hypothetical protein
LLAVMDHTTGAVLAQADVQAITNEITRFRPLLDRLDLVDTGVTADALHTQREHADWLVTQQHAADLLIVKGNQPALRRQLSALPWPDIPVADHTRDRGRGRVETRRLQVTTVACLDFPHATQAIRVTRRARSLRSRRWHTMTVYAITTSPPPRQAPPAWPTGSGATGAVTATSPPRCAATPATPPACCHCLASPAREPDNSDTLPRP